MKWFIGVLGVILVIILIVAFAFKRPSPSVPQVQTPAEQTVSEALDIRGYGSTNTSVAYTIHGKIVGNELHHSIRITVDKGVRRVDVIEGYDGQVISSQQFNNTEAAYDTFLQAIAGEGFSKTKDSTSSDEKGSCPLGKRYAFEAYENAEQKLHTWATSCSTKLGTFAGKRSTIEQLFKRQIPEYNKVVRGVKL